ncbi:MAG: helix-turn-helix domain-containing protein, partial [Tannerella sp.]|nr:helix-turn-helix domain-containing protein [Tannerella sp.]
MKKDITPLNWQDDLKDKIECLSLNDDFMLFEDITLLPDFKYPFKVDMTTMIICTQGTTRGRINMRSYETRAPCLVIVPSGQILQYEYVSEDYAGYAIVTSRQFGDSLFSGMQERLELALRVNENPYIPLDEQDVKMVVTYCHMFKRLLETTDNPYRIEMVKHLTLVFFYLSGYRLHLLPEPETVSPHNRLAEKFLNLVSNHYREQRQMGFYSEKLSLSPKYLSQIIKASTGKSANEWIDEYVMLEAKALLKSTTMTIQQISDEMNFPSQS